MGVARKICTQNDRVLVKPNYGTGVRRNCVKPNVTSAVLAFFSKNGNRTILGEGRGGASEIVYGNCLKKYRDEANFIHGCPPGFLKFTGVDSIQRILQDMSGRE
jgi:hypothetical protein